MKYLINLILWLLFILMLSSCQRGIDGPKGLWHYYYSEDHYQEILEKRESLRQIRLPGDWDTPSNEYRPFIRKINGRVYTYRWYSHESPLELERYLDTWDDEVEFKVLPAGRGKIKIIP